MTPERRRQQLNSLGYVVMRQPFRSESVFCMKHVDHKKGGQLYSIDLANGRWNRWGVDGVWHEWEQLVNPEPFTTQVTNSSDAAIAGLTSEVKSFVAECEAAGFLLEPNHATTVDFGNRFARFDGRRYLLCPQTQQIIDGRFEKHTLDEFVTQTSEVVQPPPTRPFVSMREQPVTVTGRSCQPSLF